MSQLKSLLGKIKQNWNEPPAGNYIPYKEVVNIGAAGFGVLIGALFHSATLEELSFANLGSMIGVEECILFAALLFATNKWKKHPIFYIVLSAVVGIVFAL